MDLLYFYPWEARWAENPEGRPRQKLEQEKNTKKKKQKMQKEKKENKKERCKEKNEKIKKGKRNEKNWKEKKNYARKVENPQRAPWQKLEPKKERLIPECTLTPNYVRLDSHLWDT